jgi:hypothetical protein
LEPPQLCVFDRVSPSLSLIMVYVKNEFKFWVLARARDISYLTALPSKEVKIRFFFWVDLGQFPFSFRPLGREGGGP